MCVTVCVCVYVPNQWTKTKHALSALLHAVWVEMCVTVCVCVCTKPMTKHALSALLHAVWVEMCVTVCVCMYQTNELRPSMLCQPFYMLSELKCVSLCVCVYVPNQWTKTKHALSALLLAVCVEMCVTLCVYVLPMN